VADVQAFVDKVSAARGGGSGMSVDPDRLAMIRAMVDRQAAQLKAHPRDADGWLRLMRSRMVLGDPAAASAALRDALAAFAGDPAAQARLRAAGTAMGVG
jgi:cytochrome c-type biogenesis protein CcmH